MAKGIKGSTPTDLNKPARTSVISTYQKLEKMRHISFMEKKDIKDYVNEAFDKVIARYEKENGPIQVK